MAFNFLSMRDALTDFYLVLMHIVLSDAESRMSFCKDFWCTAILDTTDIFVFEEAALIIVYCIFPNIYRKGKKAA